MPYGGTFCFFSPLLFIFLWQVYMPSSKLKQKAKTKQNKNESAYFVHIAFPLNSASLDSLQSNRDISENKIISKLYHPEITLADIFVLIRSDFVWHELLSDDCIHIYSLSANSTAQIFIFF